ncbi:F-box only protein 8-like [Rosa sericea]
METSRSQVVKLSYTLALGIPENVLVEILSKLPVKSLLRFLCVSQEWHALTKSSYFITRHLVHHSSCSDQSRPCLLFLSRLAGSFEDDCKPLLGFSLLRDEEITFLGLPSLPNLTIKTVALKLVGSSNGLVFCHVIDTENWTSTTEEKHDIASRFRELLIVWNPATQQFRCLPEPKNNISLEQEEEATSVLFAFDCVHDHDISEYKLVRVFSHGSDDPKDHGKEVTTFEAQVFNRSTNSWRQVKDKLEFPSYKSCFESTATTLNGVLYWKVVQKSDECYVLSFSLHEEVFSIIQLPIGIRYLNRDDYNWTTVPLYSWKDSPAIVVTDYSANGNPNIVLWVMSANEESKSNTNESGTQMRTPTWVQQVRFKCSVLDGFSMIGRWKDQFLFTSKKKNEAAGATDDIEPEDLFLYDPRSDTKRKIVKHAVRIKFIQVENYVESLLPV